ncbi:hypothetical protein [Mycoplasma feriruminatoris]|uniref:hypothetical protein n=1 Tax=Mycoplasma feriruminatoris TaxID=1179777 RepID=UPI00241DDC49|nr:hypothetical protein [Mycoplasma feriruminatoris]WFQ90227.1 hypothetical protein MFERI11561_00478 [Mycoplasma feriruminatoris]
MKKFLTILGSLTILSSSFVLVSCVSPKSDKKIEKNDNSNKNNISNEESNSNLKNDSNHKTNSKDKNNSNSNNDDNLMKDEPSKNEKLSDEEKKTKINDLVKKTKDEISKLIDSSDLNKLKEVIEAIISKNIQKVSESKQSKIDAEFNNNIKKWLGETSIENIQTEFLLFFNEFIDQSIVVKNINKYKEIFSKKDKENIVRELQELFANTFREDLERMFNVITTEINKLLTDRQYDKLKEKLFKLIDETAKLENVSTN